MTKLSSDEHIRYSRQMILPQIGEQGQEKIRQAKVFVAGLGGLGSVSAYYMAAVGVGSLTIADMDMVSPENLNRQIIHRTYDIARPKTASALEKLRELNPACRIRTIQEEIRDENIRDMIGDCEIILDGTDNIITRKVLNRISLSKNIPFIYGGIDGFNGMLTTFIPGETPCFECLFPRKRIQKGKVPALGPVPGLVASLQSLEAVKIILGTGGILKSRLLYIQGLDMIFKEIGLERNSECAICHPPFSGSSADSH